MRQLVGVAHHRHDEALVGADGDADVIVILVDEVGAVDLGVDRGNLLQRLNARFDEEAHEAKLGAMLFLEGVLVAGAQRHHFAHVDLVEGREHRRGVLRVLEAAGDGLTQLGHAHPFFAGAVVGGGRARRGHGSRSGAGMGAGGCNGAGAATGEGARAAATAAITSPFSTWPRLPLPATEARSILSSAAILAAAGAGGIAVERRRRRGFGRRSLSRRLGRRRRSARELAEQRADRDRLTGLGGDLAQDPRARRVDLERHLVGLELHQRLVGLHRTRRPS